jgi:hypothetical protein
MIARLKSGLCWFLPALALLMALEAQGQPTVDNSKPTANSQGTRPDLVGRVSAGDVIPKATIFIFTAGPKVGTSTFCPSCYADCRKSAKTGAQGEFKIESLDPQLIFRILVVAKGYKPKFVSKIDPVQGPLAVDLEAVETREITPDKSIHGRVVDPAGKPVVGAVVEAHGIRKKNDAGTMWGQLPGVDPLAVTDEAGEFLLTSREAFEGLDVRVEARAFAHKQFTMLASGTARHTLTLTEGATVTGRVVKNGKPLAGVSVGMAGSDRSAENFTGNFDVGTDIEGRFGFVNLPPNVDYFIYGLMSTLKSYGAIPIRKVHAGDDGATLDVGDLTVEPAQRLAGQVVCADGQPVPAKTRLLVGREAAWDSLQVELDKDGRFDTPGIPRETLSLSARIPRYRISDRNPSLDPLNPFSLIGRMDHDVTNLIFLLERGPDLRPQFDSQLPESEWPRNRSLRGAETAPDRSSQYVVSGQVRDAQTKEPLPQFRVTPGNAGAAFGRSSWNQRNSADGTNGSYLVYLDKKTSQPILKVEAEGYLPGKFTLLPESRTNFNLTLQKGTGPSGTVLLPDGQPAQGAPLMLLSLGESQVGLRGDGTLQAWQHRELIQYTDPDGSFVLSPELDMLAVVIAAQEGFKIISVPELATNSKVVLEPWGHIKGVLHRAENLSTNEDLDLALLDGPQLNLQYHTRTDAEGRFEFDHVPPGRLQINGRNMLNDRGWTWDPLEKITLKPGQDLQVEIHAPARAAAKPMVQSLPRGGVMKAVRKPGPGPSGKILLPGGKPAVDAEVALLVGGKYIALGKGDLRAYEARQEGLVVRSGADGHFLLPAVEGTTGLVVVHEQGFAHVPLASLEAAPEITLEPWGRIEGTLHIGRRLGTNAQVIVESDSMAFGNAPILDAEAFRARTDDAGRFVITFVPPGERKIARMIPTGNGSWAHSPPTIVTVKPGVATQVSVGGTGVTIVGKLHITEREVNWQNVHAGLHNQFPEGFRKGRTPQEQSAWFSTPEAKSAMKNYRAYPIMISADGSFRAEEVLPGKYDLDIMLLGSGGLPADPSGIQGQYHQAVVVHDSPVKDDDSPADLGTIGCEPVHEAAATGQ